MFCRNCGKQIANDSIFCSFCGIKLLNQQLPVNIPNISKTNIFLSLDKNLGIQYSKQLIGFYFIWILIHFIILLLNIDSYGDKEKFFPLSRYSEINDYNFSEFLFYTIIPLAIIAIWFFIKPSFINIKKYDKNLRTIYAGFWLRFTAYWIDYIILFIVGSVFFIFIDFPIPPNVKGPFYFFGYSFILINNPFGILFSWLYFASMESSSYQGTFGKYFLKLKVTDIDGQRISFSKASVRHFGKIISVLTLFIGYIFIVFTEKKQSLHDKISKCLVINKNKIQSFNSYNDKSNIYNNPINTTHNNKELNEVDVIVDLYKKNLLTEDEYNDKFDQYIDNQKS